MAGLAALAVTPSSARPAEKTEVRRPNIVLIVADDMGYGDLGCYGCPDIRTPVIDKLASQGVRFTNFYANGPECTPTRAALMTGRYQQRVGGLECAIGTGNVGRYDDAIRLAEKNELGLPVEETSIARMLKDAGYATGLCGKWHLGYEPKFSPLRHGFDHFFGPLGGTADYFHHTEPQGDPMLYLNDKPVQREGYLTDLITQEAVGFIKKHRNAPFFLDVSYTAPHSPYQCPGDRKDKPVPQADWDVGTREDYAAMTEHMDKGIEEILTALEQTGLADNTVVIFISDNGGTDKARNAPFSGNKGGLFEGGIRVPCIVRWPGVLPAADELNFLSITMDLTASIARIARVSPAENRPFDGIDILWYIQRERIPPTRRLFWRARRGERTWRAVRAGFLKYITRRDRDKLDEFLFDLNLDPQEKTDLLSGRKPAADRLRHLLAEWEAEVHPRR
jgi:N-acetylgalactosamine-6-sulfatase